MTRRSKFWPPRELTDGRAPDVRFTLANERTFLAWIRTSFAMIAAAVALEAFAPEVVPDPVRTPLVIALLLIATGLAVYSFRRWLRVEGAVRTGREVTGSAATFVLSALLAVVGIVLAISIAVSGR